MLNNTAEAPACMEPVGTRNHQIDFLKLICSFLIVICHSYLIGDDNALLWFDRMGWVSVHIFFIISGFLMVKSVLKRKYEIKDAGKQSLNFVINKFKAIALPVWMATLMLLVMQITYIYIAFGCISENILD